ncbi:MAG: SPOR domain-containing protein [Treponema sp.]|jgi:DedD protein|nr:SPOR domain-containing protein [Treponema sp.]
MEKEQKKLLLVAVSVGVFLLVTITVAIMTLTPRFHTNEAAFSSSHPIPSGRIQPADNRTPIQPRSNISESDFNIDGERDSITAVNTPVDLNDGERLTIQIPRPTTAAVPDTPVVTAPLVTTPAVTAPTVTAPAVTTKPATQPAARPAAAANTARPAASTSTARSTSSRTVNDFWVQTGAFSAIVRAEDAKDLLASKGLTSIIENRVVNGQTWYRVRLGPYTSENEANYWLALVKTIDGFGESQVRQTTRQQ